MEEFFVKEDYESEEDFEPSKLRKSSRKKGVGTGLPSEELAGNREGSVIHHDGTGYYYYSEKAVMGSRNLHCIEKNKCSARAVMKIIPNAPIWMTWGSKPHTHAPNLLWREVNCIVTTLKERAATDLHVPIAQLIDQELSRDSEAAKLINEQNLTRQLKRVRDKVHQRAFE